MAAAVAAVVAVAAAAAAAAREGRSTSLFVCLLLAVECNLSNLHTHEK